MGRGRVAPLPSRMTTTNRRASVTPPATEPSSNNMVEAMVWWRTEGNGRLHMREAKAGRGRGVCEPEGHFRTSCVLVREGKGSIRGANCLIRKERGLMRETKRLMRESNRLTRVTTKVDWRGQSLASRGNAVYLTNQTVCPRRQA